MIAVKTTKVPHNNRLRIECFSMASTGSTTGLEFPSLVRPMAGNSTSPPVASTARSCTESGASCVCCCFSRILARRALLNDCGEVIVSVCSVAGCFASGCSSRARGFTRGFRVLLPASSGPEAGRVPSALRALGSLGVFRGFLFFFGAGRGELIVSFPGVPCP